MNVSRETLFASYLELLQRWGGTLNLFSAQSGSLANLRKLIDDCLCVVPHLPADLTRLIDLGSGQGFPAIPIAIATGVTIEMVEADRRKAAFLTTALTQLGLSGQVHTTRIEATSLAQAQCVTARALAPLPRLIPLAKPFLAPGGCALFLKGPDAHAELGASAADRDISVEIVPTARPPSTLVKVTWIS